METEIFISSLLFMTDVKVDADALGAVQLKKIETPPDRQLPTADEIATAKRLAEDNPEPLPNELLPKTGAGKTLLDLIKAGPVELKPIVAPAERPLPTADQIAVEKAAVAVAADGDGDGDGDGV
jgi:hypothetical protein